MLFNLHQDRTIIYYTVPLAKHCCVFLLCALITSQLTKQKLLVKYIMRVLRITLHTHLEASLEIVFLCN